jgi:hypothetical protein
MQLRLARLCLDCEDVHDSQQCPVCASETFAYLTRWVPAPERRTEARLGAEPGKSAQRPAGTSGTSKKKLVGYGVVGVGLVGLAEWFLRGRARIEAAAERSSSGELR